MPIIDASKQSNMTVRLALGEPACLHWTEEGRPEELQRLSYSQVRFTWNDVRLFDGNLLMQEPSVEEDMEGISFSAYDRWEWLNNHIFTKGNTSKIHYNDKDQGDSMKTCAQIMTEILNQAIADGWGCTYGSLASMTLVPPRLNFYGTSYGEAIYQVLYMQADHQAYIDNSTKVFTLVNFNALDEKSIYLGKLNNAVGTLEGSKFNVKSANLRLNLSGCKTKAILEGGSTIYQLTEELTLDSEEGRYRYWKASHANWLNTLVNNSGQITQNPPTVVIQVEKRINSGAWNEVEWRVGSSMNPKTGVVKTGDYTIHSLDFSHGYAHAQPMTTVYRAKRVTVTYAYEGSPIYKTYTADDSTAHQFGYDAVLYINQDGMRQVYVEGQSCVRNDLDQMDTMVKLLLTTLKDEKLEGSVVLDMGEKDTADVLWKQGQKVKIEYSINDVWTDRFARIQNIEYRFDTREVTLGLTSDRLPFGGSAYETMMRAKIAEKANEESTESWTQLSQTQTLPDFTEYQEEDVVLQNHIHNDEEDMGGPLDEDETKVYIGGELKALKELGGGGAYNIGIITADNGNGTYNLKEYLHEAKTWSNVAHPGGSATGGDFDINDGVLLVSDYNGNTKIAGASTIDFRIVQITADNGNGTYNVKEYQNEGTTWSSVRALNDSGSGGYYKVDDYVVMSKSYEGNPRLVDLAGGGNYWVVKISQDKGNGTYNATGYDGGIGWYNLPALNDSGSGGYYKVNDYAMVFKSHAGNAVLVDLVKSNFLELKDTPSDYTGKKNMVPVVNNGEDALEFKYAPIRLTTAPPSPENGDMWLV